MGLSGVEDEGGDALFYDDGAPAILNLVRSRIALALQAEDLSDDWRPPEHRAVREVKDVVEAIATAFSAAAWIAVPACTDSTDTLRGSFGFFRAFRAAYYALLDDLGAPFTASPSSPLANRHWAVA